MSKGKDVTTVLKDYQSWLDSLTEHDKNNYVVLINLPNAKELVAKMPPGKYREMAIFGIALISAMEKK